MATASTAEEVPADGCPSLRRRSFRDIAALAVVTWLLLSAGVLLLVRLQGLRMFDDALRERAQLVLAFTQHELEEIQAGATKGVDDDLVGDERGGMKLQVWTAGGRLAYRSPDAPPWPLVRGGEGLRDITLNGESLRAFVRWSADRQFRVEVAQAPDLREQYALAMSLLVAGAMLLGLGGFLWRLAATLRHALAPLDETARELASRTARDLHPVPLDGHPIELHAVIRAFNQMLARVRRALLHEQRFTADAAHELKTPLASLKVLLHNARQAPDEAARHDALEAMGGVVEQAGHLVDQLLALARYDQAPEQVDMTERVDLLALARQVAAPLLPIARSRGGVELLVEQTGSACTVRGNREALASLLRNLLDNAIRHARGAVHVVLCGEGPTVRVEVHDDGPGIPQAWRGRVVSRFVRVPGGATTGTGLGLAICERVAELHQGRLRLEASPRTGGALACVELRAA